MQLPKEYRFSAIFECSVSNLLPWGLERPWIRPEVSLLRFGGACLSSSIKSHSRSNCLVKGSIAALIFLATSSSVTGALGHLGYWQHSKIGFVSAQTEGLITSSGTVHTFYNWSAHVGLQNISVELIFWINSCWGYKIGLVFKNGIGSVMRSGIRHRTMAEQSVLQRVMCDVLYVSWRNCGSNDLSSPC